MILPLLFLELVLPRSWRSTPLVKRSTLNFLPAAADPPDSTASSSFRFIARVMTRTGAGGSDVVGLDCSCCGASIKLMISRLLECLRAASDRLSCALLCVTAGFSGCFTDNESGSKDLISEPGGAVRRDDRRWPGRASPLPGPLLSSSSRSRCSLWQQEKDVEEEEGPGSGSWRWVRSRVLMLGASRAKGSVSGSYKKTY